MNPSAPLPPSGTGSGSPRIPAARIVGVGGAGLQAVEHMAAVGVGEASFAVVHSDARLLGQCAITQRFLLGSQVTRGLKVGEPEVGRALAEGEAHELRHLCEGADLVLVVAGLGGNTASGAAPVLARVARENGALVLAVVVLPFDFEGRRRQFQAQAALKLLRSEADAVICLPNQKVSGLLDEKTSLPEAMKLINDLLARGVRGLLRLITRGGLINVDFSDLCQVVRGRQSESCFATAEAEGENRAREVVERLVSSPLLDAGRGVAEADALLVSLTGGPALSLRDVNLVMEQINRVAERAQVIMGALIDPALGDRLAVTLVAARHTGVAQPPANPAAPSGETAGETPPPAAEFPTRGEELRALGLGDGAAAAGPARYVPPAPPLNAPPAGRLWAPVDSGNGRRRKKSRLQQGVLPLEAVSKGRFARSEPTVHRGEDLDTPAYVRRGVPLN